MPVLGWLRLGGAGCDAAARELRCDVRPGGEVGGDAGDRRGCISPGGCEHRRKTTISGAVGLSLAERRLLLGECGNPPAGNDATPYELPEVGLAALTG